MLRLSNLEIEYIIKQGKDLEVVVTFIETY